MKPHQRDPHLPPPDVCDWLLSQEWSDERVVEQRVTNMAGQLLQSGTLIGSSLALVAIGADEIGHFDLPVEALEVLRADQVERARIKAEQAMAEVDEQRRKAERDPNRPCELGLLPMIVSETGAGGEPEVERIICSAISGGADYLNDMPREVSLERITAEGTFHARYLQGPLEVAL